MSIQRHPDNEVQDAIVKLSDALCQWERSTGRTSVLLLREQGGFFYRALSGKPNVPDDVSDDTLLELSD